MSTDGCQQTSVSFAADLITPSLGPIYSMLITQAGLLKLLYSLLLFNQENSKPERISPTEDANNIYSHYKSLYLSTVLTRKHPASSTTMARSCATHAETPSTETNFVLRDYFRMAQTARWTAHDLKGVKEITNSSGVVRLPGWGPHDIFSLLGWRRCKQWRLTDVRLFPDCLIGRFEV
ncbi:LOW QUALITY PROTEIN: hypothetical protein T265_14062 [Opisthorchis viverrini]|uniref:Uncharacterized protein n=1 Tax=Opisthorchis viverrini TaxID=6198 RepID=A0A074ZG76_OPIVI|nr:LOW QUALITY PROTEIN: hypothetical protein T265_14062 [Opisthorchis viverrini]KER26188.1 LOW QUALITY PROTEIN: hypothetical protein T265_14062 [Opisthorchis viverrini]